MSMYFTSLSLLATSSSPPVDTVRQSLTASSDRWFFWLVVSSIVVGIGVCLEGPEATIALKRWYLHWKNRDVPPENPRSLAIPASYLGLLLVILGVVGEGIFESLSSNAETTLRAHDEQVLGDTIVQAGNAAGSAERANTAAGEAKTKSDAAKTEADQVFSIADSARQTASGALSTAGDAKAQVATVQSNIAAVDAKYAPRKLSKAERDALIDFLRKAPIKPTSPISVDSSADAPDGPAYAKEIADAINDPTTEWKADAHGEIWTSDGGATGVALLLPLDAPSQPPWAGELQQALRASALGGDGVSNKEVKAGTVVILVRRKN